MYSKHLSVLSILDIHAIFGIYKIKILKLAVFIKIEFEWAKIG